MSYPPPHQPYQPNPGIPPSPDFTLDQTMPPGQPARKSRKLPIILAAVGVVAAVTVGGIAWAALRPGSDSGLALGSKPLEDAQTKCDFGKTGTQVTDGGDTMLLDTKGTDDPAGTDITTVVCVLTELKTPQAVIAHMDSTRALDGRQEDSWDGFTASWTYHPDNGMDLILRAA
jgi:hypothetical protein